MRLLLAIALALATCAVHASTIRFDRGIVTTGDGPGTIIQKTGRQPDRIVPLHNNRGAVIGERWEYFLRDKQVNFYISGGRITRIEEIR